MPVYVQTKRIEYVSFGDKIIAKMYYGDKLVWIGGPEFIIENLVQHLAAPEGLNIYEGDDGAWYLPDNVEDRKLRPIQPGRGYGFTALEEVDFSGSAIPELLNMENIEIHSISIPRSNHKGSIFDTKFSQTSGLSYKFYNDNNFYVQIWDDGGTTVMYQGRSYIVDQLTEINFKKYGSTHVLNLNGSEIISTATYTFNNPKASMAHVPTSTIWNLDADLFYLAIYELDGSGNRIGTVAIWNFEEGVGLNAYDATGNGNHGIISLKGQVESSFHITSNAVPSVQNEVGYTGYNELIGYTASKTMTTASHHTLVACSKPTAGHGYAGVRYRISLYASVIGGYIDLQLGSSSSNRIFSGTLTAGQTYTWTDTAISTESVHDHRVICRTIGTYEVTLTEVTVEIISIIPLDQSNLSQDVLGGTVPDNYGGQVRYDAQIKGSSVGNFDGVLYGRIVDNINFEIQNFELEFEFVDNQDNTFYPLFTIGVDNDNSSDHWYLRRKSSNIISYYSIDEGITYDLAPVNRLGHNTVSLKKYGTTLKSIVNGESEVTQSVQSNILYYSGVISVGTRNSAELGQFTALKTRLWELDASGNRIKELINLQFSETNGQVVHNLAADRPANSDMAWVLNGSADGTQWAVSDLQYPKNLLEGYKSVALKNGDFSETHTDPGGLGVVPIQFRSYGASNTHAVSAGIYSFITTADFQGFRNDTQSYWWNGIINNAYYYVEFEWKASSSSNYIATNINNAGWIYHTDQYGTAGVWKKWSKVMQLSTNIYWASRGGNGVKEFRNMVVRFVSENIPIEASTDTTNYDETITLPKLNSIIPSENTFNRNPMDAPALIECGIESTEDISYEDITEDKSRFYDNSEADSVVNMLAYKDIPEPIAGSRFHLDGTLTAGISVTIPKNEAGWEIEMKYKNTRNARHQLFSIASTYVWHQVSSGLNSFTIRNSTVGENGGAYSFITSEYRIFKMVAESEGGTVSNWRLYIDGVADALNGFITWVETATITVGVPSGDSKAMLGDIEYFRIKKPNGEYYVDLNFSEEKGLSVYNVAKEREAGSAMAVALNGSADGTQWALNENKDYHHNLLYGYRQVFEFSTTSYRVVPALSGVTQYVVEIDLVINTVGDYLRLFDNRDYSNTNGGMVLFLEYGTHNIEALIYFGGGNPTGIQLGSSTTPVVGGRYKVKVEILTGGMKLYINDSLKSTQTYSTPNGNTQTGYITANRNGGGNQMAAVVNDFTIKDENDAVLQSIYDSENSNTGTVTEPLVPGDPSNFGFDVYGNPIDNQDQVDKYNEISDRLNR